MALLTHLSRLPVVVGLTSPTSIHGNPSQTLAFVDKYGIDHIIVDKKLFDQQLRPGITKRKGFRPVYGDGLVVVLSRQLRLAKPSLDSEPGNE